MKKFLIILLLLCCLTTVVCAKEKKEMLWIGEDIWCKTTIKIDYNNERGTWIVGDKKFNFKLSNVMFTDKKLDIKYAVILMTFENGYKMIIRDDNYSDINGIHNYFSNYCYSINVVTNFEDYKTLVFIGGTK